VELSKRQKILLGVATGWPIVYIFIFVLLIFGMIAMSNPGSGGGRELDPLLGGGMLVLFAVHFFTIFLSLALTVFYIVHAVKHQRLDSNMRVVWIILFFFGGMITEPIYWYLEVWKEKGENNPVPQLSPKPASMGQTQDFRSGTYVPPNEPPDWR